MKLSTALIATAAAIDVKTLVSQNDDDRKVLRIACDTSQTWLYDMLAKQGDTKQSDDPVLTVAMLGGWGASRVRK